MNAPPPPIKPEAIIGLLRQLGLLKPKWIITFVVLVLVYALVGPWFVRTYQWSLPGIATQPAVTPEKKVPTEVAAPQPDNEVAPPVIAEAPNTTRSKSAPPTAANSNSTSLPPQILPTQPVVVRSDPVQKMPQPRKPVPGKPTTESNPNTKSTPPPAITAKPPVTVPRPTTPPPTPPGKKPAPATTTVPATGPKLGELTETSRQVFKSTAGLIYRPGSEDGHRVEHIMHHSRDDLEKPTHGVFEGDKAQILALIDEAWQIAQTNGPPKVKIEEQDGGRTVYTVFMNRKIGYKGGQSGQRQRNPALKLVKLVLEGNNVITAYPTDR